MVCTWYEGPPAVCPEADCHQASTGHAEASAAIAQAGTDGSQCAVSLGHAAPEHLADTVVQ